MRLIKGPQLKAFMKSLRDRASVDNGKGGIQNAVARIINDVRGIPYTGKR
ncbi:MAG: hypothetical protein HY758_07930 [Nitrospirae bacterium]|nr:hypothetical protein [Nitrospirota bacterium]